LGRYPKRTQKYKRLDAHLVEALRKAGHHTTTVVAEGLGGLDDESLHTVCKNEGTYAASKQ